jgi:hypothetical protein
MPDPRTGPVPARAAVPRAASHLGGIKHSDSERPDLDDRSPEAPPEHAL